MDCSLRRHRYYLAQRGTEPQPPETDTALVVNSCARGRAVAGSDLDMAVLLTPTAPSQEIQSLTNKSQQFMATQPTVQRFRSTGRFTQLHVDVFDGRMIPTVWDDGGGPDSFEIEIGNRIAHAAPLGEVGAYFRQLQSQWLPYYEEDLRLSRLPMVREACARDLEAIPFFLGRGLYFQAFFGELVFHTNRSLHVWRRHGPSYGGCSLFSSMAELLVSYGADSRAKNRRGAAPLHYASDGNRSEPSLQAGLIKYLISVGAEPNAVDKSGVAPIHRAVRTRSVEAVQALLDGGAALRPGNKSGSTPLHLAVQNTGKSGSGSNEARQRQKAIIKLLLARGAKPTDRDSRGKTVGQAATSVWIRELLNETT